MNNFGSKNKLTAGTLGFAQTVFYLQKLVFSSLLPVIVSYFAKLVDLGRRSFLIYFVPETLKFSIFKKDGNKQHIFFFICRATYLSQSSGISMFIAAMIICSCGSFIRFPWASNMPLATCSATWSESFEATPYDAYFPLFSFPGELLILLKWFYFIF